MVVSHIGFAVFANWASSNTAIRPLGAPCCASHRWTRYLRSPWLSRTDETSYLPSLDNCVVPFAKALLQLGYANDPLLRQCGFHFQLKPWLTMRLTSVRTFFSIFRVIEREERFQPPVVVIDLIHRDRCP